MKRISSTLFLLVALLFLIGCTRTRKLSSKSSMSSLLTQSLDDAAAQYRYFLQHVPADSFPKTYYADKGKNEYSNSGWWCSGFYPGTLLYLYEKNHDPRLLAEANRKLSGLEKEQFNTHTHDLGFMLYCSFGNANRLKPDDRYRQILLNGAKSLSTRFNPTVGCLRSWDSKPEDFLVIIDNMMNLGLLFYATRETDDSSFYQIAVTHANTSIKNHFRPDFSSYHLVNYDPSTGAVKVRKTVQGFADSSAWARGQAWGLYGFTETYRNTKDKRYLDQAVNIASFMLHHPNLPEDKIPYWDYNATEIPNVFRDASAAAITASALLELSTYVEPPRRKEYISVASSILKTLSSSTYKAAIGTNGGFILKHSVGHLPAKSEVDVPLSYADYYYVEAMGRLLASSARNPSF